MDDVVAEMAQVSPQLVLQVVRLAAVGGGEPGTEAVLPGGEEGYYPLLRNAGLDRPVHVELQERLGSTPAAPLCGGGGVRVPLAQVNHRIRVARVNALALELPPERA